MATRTIANGGGNWNAVGTWVEGIVPVNGDAVVATATSGQLTVNVSSACTSIDFTNYTNTFTMNAALTVAGNVTFVSAMSLAGSSTLTISATSTLTTHGKTVSFPITVTGLSAAILTLGDDLNISALLSLGCNTVNSNNINATAGVTMTGSVQCKGTTILNLTGTGTLQSTGNPGGYLGLNTNINTAGTITIGSSFNYFNNTLTYIAGTVTTTGSTLTVNGGIGSPTFNCASITWSTISFGTCVLSADMSCVNAAVGGIITGGKNVHVSGNVSCSSTQNNTGNNTFIMEGTGTLSCTSAATFITDNLTINTTGTITLGSIFTYYGGTLTYTAGTVVVGTNTFNLGGGVSATLNTSGIVWYNVVAQGTITLLSDFNATGSTSSAGSITFNGSFNVNLWGSLLFTNALSSALGTSTINLLGTGTYQSGTGITPNPMTISGNYTLQGTIAHSTNTLNITGKILNANSSLGATMSISSGTLIVSQPMYLLALRITGTSTITGVNKIKTTSVTITNGVTVTMDYFFVGTDDTVIAVTSTNTSNYTITLNAGMNAVSAFVTVRNCTLSRKGSVICTYKNANKGGNSGVLFQNQSPNKFPQIETAQVAGTFSFQQSGLRGFVINS